MFDKIFCRSLSCTAGVGVGAVEVVSVAPALSDAAVCPLGVSFSDAGLKVVEYSRIRILGINWE
jgi:hypothetical protein